MTTARTLRATAAPAPAGQPRSPLCFAQISDTHSTDVSPLARVEYFAQGSRAARRGLPSAWHTAKL